MLSPVRRLTSLRWSPLNACITSLCHNRRAQAHAEVRTRVHLRVVPRARVCFTSRAPSENRARARARTSDNIFPALRRKIAITTARDSPSRPSLFGDVVSSNFPSRLFRVRFLLLCLTLSREARCVSLQLSTTVLMGGFIKSQVESICFTVSTFPFLLQIRGRFETL